MTSCRKRILVTLFFSVAAVEFFAAGPDDFQQPATSCWMAHCNPQMSNQEALSVIPSGNFSVSAWDTVPAGSFRGLGVSANGNVIAASYADIPGVVVYNQDGVRLWDSGSLSDGRSFTSAPIVSADGHVIAADDRHVTFYNPDGSVFEQTRTPGGLPTSPIITDNGVLVLAASGGPVSAYSISTGAILGRLYLGDPGGRNYYDTVNTPCTIGNRVYISTALRNDPSNAGRLYAVDVTNSSSPLTVAWYYTFGGGSGASPLCVPNVNGYSTAIFFDGLHAAPGNIGDPTVYAVGDAGTSGETMWTVNAGGWIPASMAYEDDPAYGESLWFYWSENPWLRELNLETGTMTRSIYTGDILGSLPRGCGWVPASALSMAGDQMILSLVASPMGTGGAYVVDIDTTDGKLQWQVQVAEDDSTDAAHGQFPLVLNSAQVPCVAFTTYHSGLRLACSSQ